MKKNNQTSTPAISTLTDDVLAHLRGGAGKHGSDRGGKGGQRNGGGKGGNGGGWVDHGGWGNHGGNGGKHP